MMHRLRSCFAVLSLCALTLTACKKSTPTEPSGGSSASVSAVELVSPAANASIANASQPVTLVVKNATVTGSGTATYTFEVATDSAFAAKVATKSAVAQGANGQTTVTLDTLAAGDYYWRARAEAGSTPGPLSSASKFTIGAAITIGTPAVVSPSSGAKTSRRPTLRVTNASRTGPVGAITYKFEISTSSSFSTLIASSTEPEGSSETTFTPPTNLPANATVFWRVTAMDATNNVSGTPTAAQSLTTQQSQAEFIAELQGVTLWTGTQPTGNPGQSSLGGGWEIGDRVSYDGQAYFSPPIEALRLFDLMDRGMDPDSAISWLGSNGYPSTGQWYAGPAVIGIPHVYLALIGGSWALVHRVGG